LIRTTASTQPLGIALAFAMNPVGKKLQLADQTETDVRRREIQLIINIVEPDPEYQPRVS
jgi:hypothetical protein